MSRSLIFPLDQIQISPVRHPKWKIEIFDIRSTADTIGDIVRQQTAASPPVLDTQTGPRDFTGDVLQVTINETSSSFVEGVSATTVQLQIADPHNLFDPFNTIANPTGDGRWLRRGNVVRIKEGDARIDEDDWPITFTGRLVGQAGTLTSRDPNANPRIIQIEAVSRESDYLKSKINSRSFDIGTTYSAIALDIAQSEMGLDLDEIEFSGFGTDSAFQPIQFGDEAPLVSIARIMFVDGFVPVFDGRGVLTQRTGLITNVPARTYADDGFASSVDRPFSKLDPANRVKLRGLNSTMSKIVQPRQVLAELGLTTGYFSQDETIAIYWSEDRTQLAQNVATDVQKSISGGLSAFGGEDFTPIPAPNSLEGTIGMIVEIDTGYTAALLISIAVGYVAAAWIPDTVLAAVVGETLPVGRFVQALALVSILLLMTQIGRGQYAFVGEPFEYVFEEITAIAELEGLLSEDVVELEIENHLINSQSKLDDLARDVLFEQQAAGNPRIFRKLYDLRLETNDEFEGLTGRLFKIKNMSRTLIRTKDGGQALATADVIETTPGLAP